jgi:hypothetical protein
MLQKFIVSHKNNINYLLLFSVLLSLLNLMLLIRLYLSDFPIGEIENLTQKISLIKSNLLDKTEILDSLKPESSENNFISDNETKEIITSSQTKENVSYKTETTIKEKFINLP